MIEFVTIKKANHLISLSHILNKQRLIIIRQIGPACRRIIAIHQNLTIQGPCDRGHRPAADPALQQHRAPGLDNFGQVVVVGAGLPQQVGLVDGGRLHFDHGLGAFLGALRVFGHTTKR